jgi:hypothetical protein
MKPSLRSALADSHVAAATIAILILSMFNLGFQALRLPLYRISYSLVTDILILELPDFPIGLSRMDRLYLGSALIGIIGALTCFVMAWIFSYWVYRIGPLQSLNAYRKKLARSNHA